MKVGDLVHAPRYPYWGMGIVVDREECLDGMILVQWLGTGVLKMDTGWEDQQDLEKL